MTKWLFASAVMALAFACGGGSGSGVDSNKKIVDLNAGEREDVCEALAALVTPRTVECPDGPVEIEEPSVAECIDEFGELAASNPDCPITVGQYDACIRALNGQSDAQLCEGEFPAACAPLFNQACF
jgi:hypothetical protein